MAGHKRINSKQALDMYQDLSFHELGHMADEICQSKYPGNTRTYLIERNINYTNICRTSCSFCAFSVMPKSNEGYVLTLDEIKKKIQPLIDIGGRQILMQGGMNPSLDLGWYLGLLKGIKESFPDLLIHAFSPPEIVFFAEHFGISIEEIIVCFKDAGLDTIPGGGAEILSDRVRKIIAPAKCSASQWLKVMSAAHKLGMNTTATMMFGHAETIEERIEHLSKLRDLQDVSIARKQNDPNAGIFTAFTCWPYQPGSSRLAAMIEKETGKQFFAAGANEYLKMTALARIYLDNFKSIQASWVTQGPQIGQLSLAMGCNDIGSLMMEENVVAAAGTTHSMQLEQLKALIADAGYIPQHRF